MNEFTTFGGMLLAAALSLAAILLAVWPLLQPGRTRLLLDDDRLTELIGRKEATLKAIKDLEFDYHVGKMDAEDFHLHDQRLRRQAIGLLQQIEKLAPQSATLEQTLEQQIAAMRRTKTPTATSRSQPAANGHPAAPKPARFCTQCGATLEATHKFCAQCGAPVAAPIPAGETPAS